MTTVMRLRAARARVCPVCAHATLSPRNRKPKRPVSRLRARDSGARDDSGSSIPDRDELDVTIDYRIEDGRWRGFWLRVRGAWLRERGGGGDRESQS